MALVINFGCRLNSCESDIIQEFANELGIDDYTIINTCAVTAEAERKLRQGIRKLVTEKPSTKIILTGCAVELHPDIYRSMPGVVGIIPNDMKLKKSSYIPYSTKRQFATTISRIRGYLQIQNGCDQYCTFCIVRKTRGPNISFDEDTIVTQAKKLLEKGFKEIVLTGINISAYGRDKGEASGLAKLIRALLKRVPNLSRLRLSSIDPADIDEELISVITQEERLLPHLHESIQAGDDIILKRMLRRHSCQQVIELNERISSLRPEIVFGADIIAGFPTETDDMFNNTRDFLAKAKLSLLHIFPFSPRPGTPAARMPMVPKEIRLSRARLLKQTAQELLQQKLEQQYGKRITLLAEKEFSGKTNNYLAVKSLTPLEVGHLYHLTCTGTENQELIVDNVE